ncbi:glycoside hydrolase domain-containing protein [Streptomyces sp. NPDC012769]|uniref:glycoside hydrolase domain-containing protein n=1 Tax=Streptomyces sp. NPDC012769 TaxID=3364848 RepID=UPI0036BE0859
MENIPPSRPSAPRRTGPGPSRGVPPGAPPSGAGSRGRPPARARTSLRARAHARTRVSARAALAGAVAVLAAVAALLTAAVEEAPPLGPRTQKAPQPQKASETGAETEPLPGSRKAQGSGAQASSAQGSGAQASGAPASSAQARGVAGPGSEPRVGAVPRYFAGRAFDTCEAPSLAVMNAWRSSPYRAVGVYFGGRGRGCPRQEHLTPGWVASVHAQGWEMLPLFVGSQAPCVIAEAKRRYAIGASPWLQGTQEAGDAVRAARALGFDAASPLYLDIEAYRTDDARCVETTVRFVRAWNREVRRLGYVPGFYSSADTGVRQLERERRAGTKDLPSVIWFARWQGGPALDTESVLHPAAWQPRARIHQYAGNVTETYGGRRMLIDRNVVDAPVARVRVATRALPRR